LPRADQLRQGLAQGFPAGGGVQIRVDVDGFIDLAHAGFSLARKRLDFSPLQEQHLFYYP
jgi:hypothetical protein